MQDRSPYALIMFCSILLPTVGLLLGTIHYINHKHYADVNCLGNGTGSIQSEGGICIAGSVLLTFGTMATVGWWLVCGLDLFIGKLVRRARIGCLSVESFLSDHADSRRYHSGCSVRS